LLKNIARPVRMWRARMGGSEAPVLGSSLPWAVSAAKMATPNTGFRSDIEGALHPEGDLMREHVPRCGRMPMRVALGVPCQTLR
jgi:hypothetical protein